MRKDSCSEKEKQLLLEIFEHSPKKIILKKFAPFNRSPQSIFRFAKQLGLKRDPKIIQRDMVEGGKSAPKRDDFWSPEEDGILKKSYPFNLQKNIENLLPKRTFRAIRERAVALKIHRNKSIIDRDREIKNKLTLKKRYGVDCSLKIPETNAKARQTNLKRRGVLYPTQSIAVREKIKRTVQKKYGVDNVFQSKKVQQKAKNSLYKEGTQKCSKQQAYIARLVHGKINYPVENLNIDILLEDKIICEYDGGGHFLAVKLNCISHKKFKDQERRRDIFLKTRGYSIIRIISRMDLLPSNEILLKMIEEGKRYLKTGHSWIKFDIDNKQVRYKNFCLNYNYGFLHKLKTPK